MTVRCSSALRTLRATTVAAIVMGLFASAVSPAQAAPRAWTGPYSMVTYASQKGGTSATTRQPESDFSAVFTMATSCATGACVATASRPRIVEPDRPESVDLQLGRSAVEGRVRLGVAVPVSIDGQSQWSPARSFTFYTPQPDGSLQGMWHTDIATGACRGNVVMPVAAYPG